MAKEYQRNRNAAKPVPPPRVPAVSGSDADASGETDPDYITGNRSAAVESAPKDGIEAVSEFEGIALQKDLRKRVAPKTAKPDELDGEPTRF